jgi:hypothetical protein
VSVLAIKNSEGPDGATIVRLQERAGQPTDASVKSSVWGLDHRVQLKPWEIKTLRVELGKGRSGTVKEVSLLEA